MTRFLLACLTISLVALWVAKQMPGSYFGQMVFAAFAWFDLMLAKPGRHARAYILRTMDPGKQQRD